MDAAEGLHHQSRAPPIVNSAEPYWRKIGIWSNVSHEEFLSYRWQARLVDRLCEAIITDNRGMSRSAIP
jgi:hypothetical protein